MMKIFKPEVFQGSLKRKKYFEGWYFKPVSADLQRVYAFIPGISLNRSESHSFIQVLNGVSGQSFYITYPIKEFSYSKQKFEISVGNSSFSGEHIDLDIDDAEIKVKGRIDYDGGSGYPKRLISPGIMGWYSYVP